MNNVKKKLFILVISLFIIDIIIHTVFAQENNTIEISNETAMMHLQNLTFSENPQKSDISNEEIIIEANRNFDRSLSILNLVATLIGVLVALITIIVVIAIAVGIFEYDKLIKIRKKIENEVKNIENQANIVQGIRKKAEEDMKLHKETLTLNEKPSKEVLDKYDEFNRKLEMLEVLGATLKPDDYILRAQRLFYNENYKLALIALEKAIDLEPDNAKAWANKGAVLDKLTRYDEALEAIEKALKLQPNLILALIKKSVTLINIGRYDEAIEIAQKIIEGEKDNSTAWYNIACAYSKKADKVKALFNLEKAIRLNVDYKELSKKDEDFENFWNDADFKRLVD